MKTQRRLPILPFIVQGWTAKCGGGLSRGTGLPLKCVLALSQRQNSVQRGTDVMTSTRENGPLGDFDIGVLISECLCLIRNATGPINGVRSTSVSLAPTTAVRARPNRDGTVLFAGAT